MKACPSSSAFLFAWPNHPCRNRHPWIWRSFRPAVSTRRAGDREGPVAPGLPFAPGSALLIHRARDGLMQLEDPEAAALADILDLLGHFAAPQRHSTTPAGGHGDI